MKLLALFLVLCIQGSFGSANNQEASFRWLEERSADGIPHLAITFADGTMDHAILERYNPIPTELDKTNSPVGGCLYKGRLANERDSMVVVAGCAGDDTFQIGTASKAKNLWLTVEKGVGRSLRNTFKKDFVLVPGRETVEKTISSMERATIPSSGLVFNLAIYYDRSWNTRYSANPVDAARYVVGLSQILFNWPSLGPPITLNVVSIEFKNEDIPPNGKGLDVLGTYAIDPKAIHTRVGLTSMVDNGGIAYLGTVCDSYTNYKSAVVSAGSWSEQGTAEIMAHELGHSLGMPHDFTDPFGTPKPPRYDSKGVSCTDDFGVMDYYVTVKKWSTCSVEAFNAIYNQEINSKGKFCMPTANGGGAVNGNWGSWSAWGPCSATCGGGTQSHTRQCDSPAPANGGATCSGASTESQACNTQSCVNINWDGWAFYLCSNQQSMQLTCGTGYKLVVYGAGWMRMSSAVCPSDSVPYITKNCFQDATKEINAMCGGKQSCEFTLPQSLIDPCVGTDKYLQFNLGCAQA